MRPTVAATSAAPSPRRGCSDPNPSPNPSPNPNPDPNQARLLKRVPSLRLTADLSHWVLKTERLLDAPEEARPNPNANLDH